MRKQTRREFLKTIGLAAASAPALSALPGCAGTAGATAEKKRPPNVVLVITDDQGYGDMSCHGNPKLKTPNIDRLQAEGTELSHFYVEPVCAPTRACLMTGRYNYRTGVTDTYLGRAMMHAEEVTLAEMLGAAGYATGIFGKWHLGYNMQFNPIRQGFDEFRGYVSGNVDYHSHIDGAGFDDWWKDLEKVSEEGYCTDLITKHGINFIERHKDEPFCLYLPHESVHSPYQGRNDPPQRLPGGKRGRKITGNEIARTYKEMVEVMDEGIGKIVEMVRRLGLEHKTFIFFCSDNGATKNGSNGVLAGYKGSLWEGGHRVPAIAYWPVKIQPGTVTSQTALGMDLFPTMASIAGAKIPTELKLDGVNLLGTLTEDSKLTERTLFWRYRKERAVRKGPWKLLVRGDNVRLYNLDDDLGEKKDLAGAKPEMVRMMQGELEAWEREVSPGVELRA